MFSWPIAVLVFVIYFLLDGFYVYYTVQVTKLNSGRATISALAIYGLSAAGVLIYVANPLYIIPLLLGSGAGTFFVVEYEKRKNRK
jgi:hypothetical protein